MPLVGSLLTTWQMPLNGKDAFVNSPFFKQKSDQAYPSTPITFYFTSKGEMICRLRPVKDNQEEIDVLIELTSNGNYQLHENQYSQIDHLEKHLTSLSQKDIIEELATEAGNNVFMLLTLTEAKKQIIDVLASLKEKQHFCTVFVFIPTGNKNEIALISRYFIEEEFQIRTFKIHPGMLSRRIESLQFTFPDFDHIVKYNFTCPAITLYRANIILNKA
jgi:hypothetical protein